MRPVKDGPPVPDPQHMTVTPEIMRDILRSLDLSPNRAADDRRRPRMTLGARAILHVRGPARAVAVRVQVKDISVGGLKILRSVPMRLDEPFLISLPRNNQPPAHLLCEVVYWEPRAENIHAIGARFVSVLRDQDMLDPTATLNRAAVESVNPYRGVAARAAF